MLNPTKIFENIFLIKMIYLCFWHLEAGNYLLHDLQLLLVLVDHIESLNLISNKPTLQWILTRLVHFLATLGLEPQKVEKYQIWIVCNSSQFLHHLLFSSTVLLEWSYSTAYFLCAPHDFHFCVLLLGWVGLKHFNLLKFIKNKKLPLFREAYIQGLTCFQQKRILYQVLYSTFFPS